MFEPGWGSLFLHLGNRFQYDSAWYTQEIRIHCNMSWVNSLNGHYDKNVTKIPTSTPWKVIATSEEGGWGGGGGGQGLRRPFFKKQY